jgi:hypothetical protein
VFYFLLAKMKLLSSGGGIQRRVEGFQVHIIDELGQEHERFLERFSPLAHNTLRHL